MPGRSLVTVPRVIGSTATVRVAIAGAACPGASKRSTRLLPVSATSSVPPSALTARFAGSMTCASPLPSVAIVSQLNAPPLGVPRTTRAPAAVPGRRSLT
jgi:hypothetical protein